MKFNMSKGRRKNVIKGCFYLLIASALFVTGFALAANVGGSGAEGQNIANIADTIVTSFQSVGKLMFATAYLAGFGFVIAAIFKFKQHKDNPTQIPMGTPIAMLVIGIALIFLPSIIQPAGSTIFGTSGGTAGGFTGGGAKVIPGYDK